MTTTTNQRHSLRESLGVLRPGPFRRYMAGESVSTTGTWMQVVAEQWVMTGLTHDPFVMGLTNFAGGLPALMLIMKGGAVADRFPKRNILMICQVAQIGLACTMGVLVLTGLVQIWMVIAAAAVLGLVNAFEMPAASSLVPELVEREQIQDALAVDRSSFHTTRLIGPASAGLVIGAFGPAIAFFVNALSFIPLMAALGTITPRERPADDPDDEDNGGIKVGLSYVRGDKPTSAMLGIMALLTLFPMPVLLVLLPLYARVALGLDAAGMGFVMSTNAAGSLLGSIWLLGIARDRRVRTIALLACGVGLGMIGLAAQHWLPLAALSLFVLSFCLSSIFGLTNTLVQERVPDRLRGRVSSLSQMIFFGGQPFAALLLSGAASYFGMSPVFAVAGACFALGVLALLGGPGRHADRPANAPSTLEEAP